MKIPDVHKQIVETTQTNGQSALTIRRLLGFYGYSRRGSWIDEQIKAHLDRLKLPLDRKVLL